jgi:uncharacterized membrane protein
MKEILLYVMSLLYAAAGVYHFINPRIYMRIMPKYLPYHLQLVYISGALEILFAVLLLPESTRALGAWLIIGLLVLIFPANVQMAVSFYQKKNPYLWIALLRLPLQGILIWWAWLYTQH